MIVIINTKANGAGIINRYHYFNVTNVCLDVDDKLILYIDESVTKEILKTQIDHIEFIDNEIL